MKSTAIYVRVSSRQQDTRSQIPDLRRWVEASCDEPTTWYEEKATGKRMDRPTMERLLADVAAGKIGRIVVWRLDRLGRTAAGLTQFFDDLVRRRVGLYSLRDCLDLETPAGRLMANVLASVAAYETEVRGERQRAGIDAARAAGKQWGGSKPGRRLSVTIEQQEAVRRLRAEGTSIAAISRTVRLSRPTIYSLLGQ